MRKRTKLSRLRKSRRNRKKKISFADDLWISRATKLDWSYFAGWHYRSHILPCVRFMTLLWHGQEPIGMCVLGSAPMSLRPRNEYFGRTGSWNRTQLRMLNRQLAIVSRVVLHPTYRGAGVAAAFVRRTCELSPFRWIEALAQMGHINPFFEKAGFVRAGVSAAANKSRQQHSAIYGGRQKHDEPKLSQESHEKSQFARPVYYIFDNREAFAKKADDAG